MNQAALPLEKGGGHGTSSLLISLPILESPVTREGNGAPFTDLGLPGAVLWGRGALVLSRVAMCKDLFHSLANTSPNFTLEFFQNTWVGAIPAYYLSLSSLCLSSD